MRQLNKEEYRELFRYLEEYYGIDKNFLDFIKKNYYLYINKEGKIYLTNVNISGINFERIGLYIIKREKDGYRFSIEGSQIFGPYATKRIIEIDKRKILYHNFDEIVLNYPDGYYIMKDGKDFIGSCKIKNNILKDFVQNSRKIKL